MELVIHVYGFNMYPDYCNCMLAFLLVPSLDRGFKSNNFVFDQLSLRLTTVPLALAALCV